MQRGRSSAPKAYDPQEDSNVYIATVYERATMVRITNHVTTSLKVVASSTAKDEALARLQASMEKATRTPTAGGITLISVTEDPELAKRKAEITEREQIKAQKKLAQNAQREAERTNRTLSKHGLGRSVGGGLSMNDLEGDGGPSRKRGAAITPKKRRPARRDMDSDTDEGMGPRGRTREDEYDKTDDFLADSDEEEEDAEGDEEDEEEEEEVIEKRRKKSKRKESPVAEGDGGARGARRRRIVDDEDDE
jgi:RNA polymerase-associated protein LEO1